MDINEAERKIAEILKQLEIDTGMLVQNLALGTIEITAIGDERRIMQRRVEIELARTPGNQWAV